MTPLEEAIKFFKDWAAISGGSMWQLILDAAERSIEAEKANDLFYANIKHFKGQIQKLTEENARLESAYDELSKGIFGLEKATLLKNIEKLTEENAAFIEALSFYAAKENYEGKLLHRSSFEQYEPSTYAPKLIVGDNGTKARDVLGRFKK